MRVPKGQGVSYRNLSGKRTDLSFTRNFRVIPSFLASPLSERFAVIFYVLFG